MERLRLIQTSKPSRYGEPLASKYKIGQVIHHRDAPERNGEITGFNGSIYFVRRADGERFQIRRSAAVRASNDNGIAAARAVNPKVAKAKDDATAEELRFMRGLGLSLKQVRTELAKKARGVV